MEKERSPLELFQELRELLESLDCEESAAAPRRRSEALPGGEAEGAGSRRTAIVL